MRPPVPPMLSLPRRHQQWPRLPLLSTMRCQLSARQQVILVYRSAQFDQRLVRRLSSNQSRKNNVIFSPHAGFFFFLMNIITSCCCLISSVAKQTVTLTGRAAVVVVAKRDANDKPSDDDCVIYRYGSFCTGIEVFGEFHQCYIH